MKNNDILNQVSSQGYKPEKLINVQAKVVFYKYEDGVYPDDDYLGIRVYLPKVVLDQIEKAKRSGNFNLMEVEDRERGEEVNFKFLDDGTTSIDTGYFFFK